MTAVVRVLIAPFKDYFDAEWEEDIKDLSSFGQLSTYAHIYMKTAYFDILPHIMLRIVFRFLQRCKELFT